MNKILNRFHNPSLGILFIRIALGAVFINAGFLKLHNIDFVVSSFETIGISAPLAYFVTYAELIGGILLILGLWTRFTSIVLAIIMFVAIVKVHFIHGFSLQNSGYEYVFVLMLGSLALLTLGAGAYSVQRLWNKYVRKS